MRVYPFLQITINRTATAIYKARLLSAQAVQLTMAVPQYRCYFMVSPAPVECPDGLQDGKGRFFYVKFGDGYWDNGGRYTTNNPSFSPSDNRDCTNNTFYTVQVNPGTYLEDKVFGSNGLNLERYMRGEWYKIRPRGGIQFLRDDLKLFGTKFEKTSLGYTAAQNHIGSDKEKKALATAALKSAAVDFLGFLKNHGQR
ncbi:unnamed protein product [Rhizoctonia solani]|uniref:Uncharacterized protein n=1 Tax=Rhizoctonia solani TaxID=456999 RepID=A0A8H3A3Z2_9AGAM|nr:unnamed protein product [Rhizoctonia solani]